MKKTFAIILLAALLAISSCGDDGVLPTPPSDAESETASDMSVAASENEPSDEESPAESSVEEDSSFEDESSIEDESSVEEESSVEDESSVEEESSTEESDIPEDPGNDLFDYGIPQKYIDGYIYYVDANYRYIGRVKSDGTDKTRYSKELKINFIKFWQDKIVFISGADSKVYTMNHDGSDIKCISGDIKANTCYCYPDIKYKDKIVFGTFDEEPRYGEYYIVNPDGSELQTIDYYDFVLFDEEWSYGGYEAFLDKRLYRHRHGNEEEKQYLTDFNILSFKKVDDVIYCIPHDAIHPIVTGLWRVNTDGSELKQLCDDIIWSYSIVDDYIYYSTQTHLGNYDYDFGAIYRMKTDGTEREQLTDENTRLWFIKNETVFFFQNDSDSLCIMDTDGGNKRVIWVSGYYLSGGNTERYIFFLNSKSDKLYIFDFETREFSFFSKIE